MAFASRVVCLLLLSLALCQAASGESTATVQIVTSLNEITMMSANLDKTASGINDANALTEGPKIAPGFEAIIKKVSAANNMMSNSQMSQLTDPDAKLVVKALTDFVKVHQQLLAAVIGDHGFAAMIPFFAPIREALRHLEGAVDAFAFALIAVIPTESAAASQQFDGLRNLLEHAIDVYNKPVPGTTP